MASLLSVEEALARVLERTPLVGEEELPLARALHRILAEPVAADRDQPPFTKSAMDGFAVRSADVANPPVELEVALDLPAGAAPGGSIGRGQAARIMTGAPVPGGADAVVMVERTESAGPSRARVHVLARVNPGENVVVQGTDARAGDVLIEQGAWLVPAALGVAAAVGRATLRVRARPRAVFLSTGDELVPIDQSPGPGQIRNSNAYAVGAQLELEGAHVVRSEIVGDTESATREAVRRALSDSDLVVLSGGVSMGERDHVARALALEGVETAFHKVAMKPGKPLVFGTRGRTLVFGLPGNPVSSYMTFLLFVAPAIRKMTGRPDSRARYVPARLAGGSVPRRDRAQFLPASLEVRPVGLAPEGHSAEGFAVRALPWGGSGDLFAIARADGFLAIGAGEGVVREGDVVRVLVDGRQIAPVGVPG